jgi:cellobionic acid phosphorylase
VYRCFIEGLCGLKGDAKGLLVNPQLPSQWQGFKVTRSFRGAKFTVNIRRGNVKETQVWQAGKMLPEGRVTGIQVGKSYELEVVVPGATQNLASRTK